MSSESNVTHEVDRVLSGALAYDDAGVGAQRRVRDVWSHRATQRSKSLDLAAEFRAQGRRWSECDADGNVVICS